MAFVLQKLFTSRAEAEQAITDAKDIPDEIKAWALKGTAAINANASIHVNIFGNESKDNPKTAIHHVQVAIKEEPSK